MWGKEEGREGEVEVEVSCDCMGLEGGQVVSVQEGEGGGGVGGVVLREYGLGGRPSLVGAIGRVDGGAVCAAKLVP